ncbi:SDR family oxidoreductase [Cryptosporangium arvum]|uniref:SDR family oxidoreductase n=1 Tax=Cryptosporangium arvum TaxID=80871 RepID=UPI0004B1C11D|nr:SDR family oxidoreductase [Cryptosporangium arvum]
METTNTVVVITGASSGIGEATARLLSSRGARLVLGARRTDRLEALASSLGDAVYAATDVRRRDDVTALVDLALDRFGRVDAFVGNAGIGPVSHLADLRVDEWDAMVDVNIKGVLHGIAAALPVFRAQGSGHFVTTASTAAFRTLPTMAVYAATKTAVRVIAEGLRQESDGAYRVTTVTPGFIATDFAGAATDREVRADLLALRDRIAIPPSAVAEAIAFALAQPPEVDVNELVIRPVTQG